jgi:hypothetical protein
MTFDEWFHKEYEPADLQIKQYAERKEGLHIPATVYLEDLKKAFEAGQKDKEAHLEKSLIDVSEKSVKRINELELKIEEIKSDVKECFGFEYNILVAKLLNKWEIKEK